ncbi:unnamed protein product [Effrenium voratum]|nr:unnamed protein product [Effrenium voratum]
MAHTAPKAASAASASASPPLGRRKFGKQPERKPQPAQPVHEEQATLVDVEADVTTPPPRRTSHGSSAKKPRPKADAKRCISDGKEQSEEPRTLEHAFAKGKKGGAAEAKRKSLGPKGEQSEVQELDRADAAAGEEKEPKGQPPKQPKEPKKKEPKEPKESKEKEAAEENEAKEQPKQALKDTEPRELPESRPSKKNAKPKGPQAAEEKEPKAKGARAKETDEEPKEDAKGPKGKGAKKEAKGKKTKEVLEAKEARDARDARDAKEAKEATVEETDELKPSGPKKATKEAKPKAPKAPKQKHAQGPSAPKGAASKASATDTEKDEASPEVDDQDKEKAQKNPKNQKVRQSLRLAIKKAGGEKRLWAKEALKPKNETETLDLSSPKPRKKLRLAPSLLQRGAGEEPSAPNPDAHEKDGAGKRKSQGPLDRLGFRLKDKAEASKQTSNPVAVEEVDVDAEADQEPKRRRFDWSQGFAKLAGPGPKISRPISPVQEVVPVEVHDASPRKAAKRLSKSCSKKELCTKTAGVVDWAEKHAPSNQKQLRPEKAWQDLRLWLRAWRPNNKGQEAALVIGPPGCGKSACVRFTVRKLRGQFVEYDLADLQGRSFIENLAKKQRNSNQLSEDAMSQVLVCNIAEQLSPAQKESLALAVQASPGPVILTAVEGLLGSKDAVMKMCLEIRISLAESTIARQIQDIARRESSELSPALCAQIASACPGDLRKAIAVAQLLGASSGEALLPQATLAPLPACGRLLSQSSLDEALDLLDLDAEIRGLLRWNCLPALAHGKPGKDSQDSKPVAAVADHMDVDVQEPQAEEAEEPKEAKEVAEEADRQMHENKGPHAEEVEAECQMHEEPKEAKERAEDASAGKKAEEPQAEEAEAECQMQEAQEEPKDTEEVAEESDRQHEELQAEEAEADCQMHEEPKQAEAEADTHEEETQDAKAAAEEADHQMHDEDCEVQAVIPGAGAPSQEELERLSSCARIASLLALSDAAARSTELAAEQAGAMVDCSSPADEEPLLLAIVSREVQSYNRVQGYTRAQFQPSKALPDPVCPINTEQFNMLASQLSVPKAWILDRLYDWLIYTRSNASMRTLKNFKTWLKRQVQVWLQRQECRARGRASEKSTAEALGPESGEAQTSS